MKKEKYKYLETILVICLGLFAIYWMTKQKGYFIAAFSVGGVGVLIPSLGRLIHKGWMKLAELLGFVGNRVLMGVIFLVVLTPVALLSRIRKKNGMLTRSSDSYYKVRNHTYSKSDLENPW